MGENGFFVPAGVKKRQGKKTVDGSRTPHPVSPTGLNIQRLFFNRSREDGRGVNAMNTRPG
jgi:hypothetical protein